MSQNTIRVSVLLPCAALLAGALHASTIKSENIAIPFEFRVQHHKMMPAGEYRVEQEQGSDIASLVNTKTGERIQFLRPATTHKEGHARLVFEDNANGHVLKRIS